MNPHRGAFETSCKIEPPSGEEMCMGLTVRAYIATAAMQGILSGDIHGRKTAEIVVYQSIECADLLMAELAKKDQKHQ